jgi:hypothetical protein
MKRYFLAMLFTCVALSVFAEPASAQLHLSLDATTKNVMVIGSLPDRTIAIHKRSNGTCSTTWLAGSGGLTQTVYVHGGWAADTVYVINPGNTVNFCGTTLSPPKYGVNGSISINGNYGSDLLVGDAKTFIAGHGDNDLLVTGGHIAAGDEGDDVIFAVNAKGARGGSGNDTICAFNIIHLLDQADGGSGTDSMWGYAASTISIESRIADNNTSCSWLLSAISNSLQNL